MESTLEISEVDLEYFRRRLRNRLHGAVLSRFVELFDRDEIRRSDFAKRLGKRPEVITRYLQRPGNWTLDTLSDLLLGLGVDLEFELRPLDAPRAVVTRFEFHPRLPGRVGVVSSETSATGEVTLHSA